MLNHSLSFGLLIFLSVDLKLKSLEEGMLNQSSQKSYVEQPTGNVGAGWLFIAAAFPEGKRPNWTCGAANGRTTRVQQSEIEHNGNISCGASNANSSV
jgi:hypothetical protein